MFQLEIAIENWKQQLLQHQTMTAADIEELQIHLLEEMDALTATGLNQEEAFLIASRRIGNPNDISCEFAKINHGVIWKNRFFWMIIGILILQIFSSCAVFLARGGALIGCQLIGWNPLNAGIISAAIQITVLLCLFTAFYIAAVPLSMFRKIPKKTLIGAIIAVTALNFFLSHAAGMGYNLLIARFFSVEQLGQFSRGCSYSAMGLSVLWPVVWLVLLLWLLPGKTQSAS
ncbi:MAG TPA: permease prefix domain 1-containing protein [Anaerohalosphaeraceae bacterium]|nr:permease prefix domain 1-containing protein [Anaerohalosphaeraceae bacterium]